jgi:hypothetical protein
MTPTSDLKENPQQKNSLKGWLARLGAVLFGLLLAWLLLEILLRLVTPILPPLIQAHIEQVRTTPFSPLPPAATPFYRRDAYFGMIARQDASNSYQLEQNGTKAFRETTINWLDPNSQVGFRVPSKDWQPRWPVDAVVVGDSFSFCITDYADCWVQRLDTDHGLSVVNLGLDATGTTSHQRILETFGLPYKPRMVIWQWYGNDFNDDYGLLSSQDITNPFLVVPAGPGPQVKRRPSIGKWLSEYSDAFVISSLALNAVSRPPPSLAFFRDLYQLHDGTIDFTFGRPYVQESFDLSNPKNQQGLETSQQALHEAHARLAASGISLVLVLIPSKEEVYRQWTEGQLGSAWFDSVGKGRQEMHNVCQTENLQCLDMAPILTSHANRREMVYWPDDFHLNPSGNRIVSDSVWEFLAQQGLVQK